MAGKTVIVHDRRLKGEPPQGDFIIVRCSGKTPLSTLVSCIANLSVQWGGELRLKIMCHGYEDKAGRGGYGLQLCAEGLKLNTVNQLAPLNGKMNYYMTIYACATADVAPGKEGGVGDGRMLCSRIAAVTGTGLFAADATQYYYDNASSGIDFGSWEGNVLEFNAAGSMEKSPRPPRDL